MAFERPCLVFADMDGNMYDEPDLHMLSMDASGLNLPRPDELIPLPDHCKLVLLPGRYALGLDPETGEVAIHEGLAVAALVPSNYLAVGLPAAHSDTPPPALPPKAYAAVGFAHNRFYIAAKKINEAPQSPHGGSGKKLKKASTALCAQYPENRLVHHLVNYCVRENNCRAAKNFCLGASEMLLPTSPCAPCDQRKPVPANIPQSQPQPHRQNFSPTPQEMVEVMTHHARFAPKAIISLGHPCNWQSNWDNNNDIIEAVSLFRRNDKQTPIMLYAYDTVTCMCLREKITPTHAAETARGNARGSTCVASVVQKTFGETDMHDTVSGGEIPPATIFSDGAVTSDISTSETLCANTPGDISPALCLPPLEAFAQAGLSGIICKISCCHTRYAHNQSTWSEAGTPLPANTPSASTGACQNDVLDYFLHRLLTQADSLGLRCTLQYEYFAGLSDTEKEVGRLVSFLKKYAIQYLHISNYLCDPHQVFDECQTMDDCANLGPVMGIGNFLKHIKRECPDCVLVSATSFYPHS